MLTSNNPQVQIRTATCVSCGRPFEYSALIGYRERKTCGRPECYSAVQSKLKFALADSLRVNGMCRNGKHKMEGDNVYTGVGGWRRCKGCIRDGKAARAARKAEIALGSIKTFVPILCDVTDDELRRRYVHGEPVDALARRYHVHPVAVRDRLWAVGIHPA